MTDLPWERGLRPAPQPTVREDDTTEIPVPPLRTPVSTEGGWITQEQLQGVRDAVLEEVKEYGLDIVKGAFSGKDYDLARPTITVTTNQGKEIRIADAKNRSFRTLLQGFALDFAFALMAVIGTLSGNEFFSKAGWATVGVLVAKTLLQTVVSYVSRINIEPTIKTSSVKAALVPVTEVVPMVTQDGGKAGTAVMVDSKPILDPSGA
ncbi:hypothetical protein SEA_SCOOBYDOOBYDOO_241 [Mycobacterium phage ScoobyDoobyDoo]|nr:hypothetical protein SEA_SCOOBYDOOBYDOO_241 [Mycobacterium phage ScoobyDoobyDoo]